MDPATTEIYTYCHTLPLHDAPPIYHQANNDLHALQLARDAMGRLNHHKPAQLRRKTPAEPLYDPQELNGIIPSDTRKPYDVREVIARIVDGSEFDEFKARFGTTLVTGFAHIHRMPVGILANNGILFSEAAQKCTHFLELCCQRDRKSTRLNSSHECA